MSGLLHRGPTVGGQVMRALGRYPDRVAFRWDGGSLTYAGAAALIGRMQQVMTAAGLKRGERVALIAGNNAEAWCAGNAAMLNGLCTTWLHPLGSLADQLDQIEDSDAAALVADSAAFGERGGELASRAAGLKTVLTLGPANYGRDLIAAAEAAGECTARDFAAADAIATLNYTGGTTGKSKGAYRRHFGWTEVTNAVLANFEFPRDPRYLAVAPITHVAGTKVVPTLMLGGTIHLQKGFDPERVLATLARERINLTLFVPTMIYVLLDHPKLAATDLSALEVVFYGASPMAPARLSEALERIGPVFSQLYGQTEGYPISVLRKSDHDSGRPELFASCGFPVAGMEVKLLDEAGQEVATGEPGEICARGPAVMESYWKRPEQTAETLRDGWLHTGDIARADEQGYLYIVDRKKDMIVTGGFNVFPREVEDVLATHAGVAVSAVIGVPDEKWGEAVTAFIVRRPGADPAAEELIQLVKTQKGSAQAPKRVEFVDSLPLTAVGKVDKKVLRAKFWAGKDRQVG